MDFIETIIKKCQPFLSSLHGSDQLLLRGFSREHGIINGMCQEDNIFKNRKPKNMPLFFHNAADNWFLKRFGVKYRSNVVMCTGEWSIAEGYGDVYAIFPVGSFSVCWSGVVQDLFGHMSSHYPGDPDSETDVQDFLDSLGYQVGDLKGAIKSQNELLINCRSFIRVRVKSQHQEKQIIRLLTQLAK